MSVTQNLISGETIVFESKKHWFAPIRASLVAGLMVIGAWLLWLIAPAGGEGLFGSIGGALGTLMDIAALVLVVGGVGWIIYNIVAWRTAEFAVTNMRVLREEGLASKRSSTTLLSSLSDVRTTGRLPRRPARLRGRHPVDDVRPGRRRPVPRDHEAATSSAPRS